MSDSGTSKPATKQPISTFMFIVTAFAAMTGMDTKPEICMPTPCLTKYTSDELDRKVQLANAIAIFTAHIKNTLEPEISLASAAFKAADTKYNMAKDEYEAAKQAQKAHCFYVTRDSTPFTTAVWRFSNTAVPSTHLYLRPVTHAACVVAYLAVSPLDHISNAMSETAGSPEEYAAITTQARDKMLSLYDDLHYASDRWYELARQMKCCRNALAALIEAASFLDNLSLTPLISPYPRMTLFAPDMSEFKHEPPPAFTAEQLRDHVFMRIIIADLALNFANHCISMPPPPLPPSGTPWRTHLLHPPPSCTSAPPIGKYDYRDTIFYTAGRPSSVLSKDDRPEHAMQGGAISISTPQSEAASLSTSSSVANLSVLFGEDE